MSLPFLFRGAELNDSYRDVGTPSTQRMLGRMRCRGSQRDPIAVSLRLFARVDRYVQVNAFFALHFLLGRLNH
jgi:hypothetical protein